MRKATKKTLPALRLPKPETNDAGTVRLGSSNISPDFELKTPAPETSDRGTVRLGSSNISADFTR